MERYPLGGLAEVMRRIAQLVREGIADAQVRRLALQITQGVTPHPTTGLPDRTRFYEMAAAVYDYVSQNVAYVHDPDGVERLESARYTLSAGAGDCDAHTVLGMSLLGSLGIETRFVYVGADPSQPEAITHIYFDYKNERGQWTPFDTTLATHAGDAVPDALVTREIVATLDELAGEDEIENILSRVAGVPVMLATLRGASSIAAAAAETSAVGDITSGPISGPYAWLQITRRSHNGEVPSGELFYIDVYVERAYEFMGTCDVHLAAKSAETGDVIAQTRVDLSKWSGFETCEGQGRLNFPAGFQPTGTALVLEITDDDYFGDQVLGASEALFLTRQEVEERGGWLDDAREGAESLHRTLRLALLFGLPIAGAFVLRPYVEDYLESYGGAGK